VKLSTRIEFVGTITGLVRGPVSTEVKIRIADGVEIVSVITTKAATRSPSGKLSCSTRYASSSSLRSVAIVPLAVAMVFVMSVAMAMS